LYILNIYKREFLEREIAMAYQSAEAIHRLNIGMPDNSAFNGLQNSLEQGSVQGYTGNVKKSNADPIMNGATTIENGGVTAPQIKPNKPKVDYKDATTMVNAMVNDCINQRNDIYIDFSKSNNPLLR